MVTSAGEIRWNTGFGSSRTREKESRLPLLVTASVRVCGTGKYPASDNERKVFAPKEDSLSGALLVLLVNWESVL